jgi:hypothetical protein
MPLIPGHRLIILPAVGIVRQTLKTKPWVFGRNRMDFRYHFSVGRGDPKSQTKIVAVLSTQKMEEEAHETS